jgi:hypothetical protein
MTVPSGGASPTSPLPKSRLATPVGLVRRDFLHGEDFCLMRHPKFPLQLLMSNVFKNQGRLKLPQISMIKRRFDTSGQAKFQPRACA